ncbi:uncharacterized protein LOC106752690 [Vigna radiata var. radiata]|uniref:Uncharacterized protein LOC106752690 n=1 Tax=Vigna radiata var. radiata TaxID=3916 RepID=A0A1S3T820_VIGRR|nr:uncharacterized protein LOC106752690 [Vigna radiata var. radiata]
MSLQDFMKIMLEKNSEIKKLIVDLTQRVEKLEAKESNKLHAQTVINPQNVSVITLRTGKQVQGPKGAQEDEDKNNKDEQVDDNGGPNEASPETTTKKSRLVPPNSSSKNSSSSYSPPTPYPNWLKLRNKKMEEIDQGILNTFKKVEISIPLLDAVKQIPKYAKFLKEICTNRRRFGDNETTGVVIQLANRSTVNPASVLEDVLFQVDKLIFPTDFYILDVKDEEGISPNTIILGRPFMMTT